MLAVRVGKEGGHQQAEIAWRYTKQVPNVSSPVVVGDMIFFVSDQGIASCLDANTGEAHWTERIGKHFWASPFYADGRIYFFDRDGTTTVVEADKKYQRLAINKLDGEMLATAAAVDNALILRTDKRAVSIAVVSSLVVLIGVCGVLTKFALRMRVESRGPRTWEMSSTSIILETSPAACVLHRSADSSQLRP